MYAPFIEFTPAAFRIRSSAAYNITSGMKIGLSEKQEAELTKLRKKEAGEVLHGRTGKPLTLTDNDRVKMGQLIEKKNAKPHLSTTAKTMCKDWVRGMVYNQMDDFWNKYTRKGTKVEVPAIYAVRDYIGRPFMIPYTEGRVIDADITGLADIVEPDIGADIKAPWWAYTHPVFDTELESKIYNDQGVCYCEIYDRPWWLFIYILMDAPESVIQSEIYRIARERGEGEPTEEIENEVRESLTYSHEPMEKRVRLFWVKRDDKRIKLIREAVKLCREYIHELLLEFGMEQSIYPPDHPKHEPAQLTALTGAKKKVA